MKAIRPYLGLILLSVQQSTHNYKKKISGKQRLNRQATVFKIV